MLFPWPCRAQMAAKHRRVNVSVEALENRYLFSVTPLTLADPSLYGATANSTSQFDFLVHKLSLSADGQVIGFQDDYSDNLVPGGFLDTSYVRDLTTGTVAPLNARPDGQPGNAPAFDPTVSSDGNVVAFVSAATDLTADKYPSNSANVFLRDVASGTTRLVSVTAAGNQAGDQASSGPFVSARGRYVAFTSAADDLTDGDTNNRTDLFVRDMQAGTTRRVDLFSPISLQRAAFTADERHLFFATDGPVAPNDTNGTFDIYRLDLQSGDIVLVSANPAGQAGNGKSLNFSVTPDGRYVAFESQASDLRAGTVDSPTNQIYVRDLQTGTTTLVSATPAGAPGRVETSFNGDGGTAFAPFISDDGRFVTWTSGATDLTGIATQGGLQVYRRDLQSGTTDLVSVSASGTAPAMNASAGNNIAQQHLLGMSGDGHLIAFVSDATNLTTTPTSGAVQVYLSDETAGTTRLVSINAAGTAGGNGLSGEYDINLPNLGYMSANGARLFFGSLASDLIAGDNNRGEDIFAYDIAANRLDLVTARHPTLPQAFTATAGGQLEQVSPDGRFVLFHIAARVDSDLVVPPGGTLFLRDRMAGTTVPVSVDTSGMRSDSASPDMTPDGRFVVFDPLAGKAILLRDVQAGTTVALSAGTGTLEGPRISPDGRFVAFLEDNGTLWLYDRQANAAQKLTAEAPTGGYAFSPDNRFLALVSSAGDVVPGVASGTRQVYLRDLAAGTSSLVSGQDSSGGNGDSGDELTFSASGNALAFTSNATDLAPGANPSGGQIYVRDLNANVTRLGTAGGTGQQPQLSADGRYLAFLSTATFDTYTPGTSAPRTNVFWRDLQTGTTRLISVNAAGAGPGNGDASAVALSGDGQKIAFVNSSTDLVPGFTAPAGVTSPANVYVRDLATSTTTLLSTGPGGAGSNHSDEGAGGTDLTTRIGISTDGAVVVFSSGASNLYAGDTNGTFDVFAASTTPSGGIIQGTVFSDDNQNGARDQGEAGLAGVHVYVDANGNGVRDPSELTTLTGPDGGYTLTGVPAGTSVVRLDLPTGQTQTVPAASAGRSVTLKGDGDQAAGQDFGVFVGGPDLVVENISAPAASEPGQTIPVTWTVRNAGAQPAGTPWQDAVYLSASPKLDGSAVLLTTVPHAGPLAPGSGDPAMAQVTLPGVLPGTYYLLVQADRRHAFQDRTAPLGAASGPLQLSIPTLAIGTPINATFPPGALGRYYQLALNAGDVAQFDLTSQTTASELYVRAGALPSPSQFDFRAAAPMTNQQLLADATTTGPYYVLVRTFDTLAPGQDGFTLLATQPVFGIGSIDQSTADKGGPITLGIHGQRFSPDMTATLDDGAGHQGTATKFWYVDPTQVYATFDTGTLPVGKYNVGLSTTINTVVQTGDPNNPVQFSPQTFSAVLNGALLLTDAAPDDVAYNAIVPPVSRVGIEVPINVQVVNRGTHDVPAPLLEVSTVPAVPIMTERSGAPSAFGSMQLLALGDAGPAGILRPGQVGTVQLRALAPPADGTLDVTASLVRADQSAVDYSDLFTSLGIDTTVAPGSAALAAVQAQYGNTAATFQAGLRDTASRALAAGDRINSVPELLMNTAFAAVTDPPPGTATVPVPTPQPDTAGGSGTPPPPQFTDAQLQQKEALLIGLVAALAGPAPAAANHLGAFLGPLGPNTGYTPNDAPFHYQDGSAVSEDAKTYTGGVVPFPTLNEDVVKPEIRQTFELAIRKNVPASQYEGVSIDVTPLVFYNSFLATLGVSGFSLLGGRGLDLQFAFGAMQKGKVILHNVQFTRVDDCAKEHVRYSADLEYQFDDVYDFGSNDLTGSTIARLFNGSAYDLQHATPPWATGFPTGIQIKDKVAGELELQPKAEPGDSDCVLKTPKPLSDPFDHHRVIVRTSFDPNDLTGPGGFDSVNFIDPAAAGTLPYTIHFENDPQKATAPAQEVTVTHQLDSHLDWSTFELGSIRFGDRVVDVPPGLQAYQTQVDYHNADGSPLRVDVAAALDQNTGVVTWTFRSVDPATGALPTDPLAGFLPPNTAGKGDGYLEFRVRPKAGLPTGTTLNEQASIVFDTNQPLDTNVFTNTLDVGAPSSSVQALPATETAPTFTVAWAGQDDPGGSGIASFDIFVSDNGGAFVPLLTGTTQTSTSFTGQPGHAYAFYSVATDHVGHREPTPAAQAMTTVGPPSPGAAVSTAAGGSLELLPPSTIRHLTKTPSTPVTLQPVQGAALQADPVHHGMHVLVVGPPAGTVLVRLHQHKHGKTGHSVDVTIRQLSGGQYHYQHTFALTDVTGVVIFAQKSNVKLEQDGGPKLTVTFHQPAPSSGHHGKAPATPTHRPGSHGTSIAHGGHGAGKSKKQHAAHVAAFDAVLAEWAQVQA